MSQVLSLATSQDDSGQTRLSRSYVACKRCHAHKVKCSGETPKCRNCQQAKKPSECVYPVRDRKLSISESYLKRLEAENKELKRKRDSDSVSYTSQPPNSHDAGIPAFNGSAGGTASREPNLGEDLTFENDETFIHSHYIGEAACTTFGSRLHQYLTANESTSSPRRPHHYYKNQRLSRLTSFDYELPNRNDAQMLVGVVLRFIGPDYHLILRRSFLDRLDQTYRLHTDDDRVWLCRLFVVFALGELYSQRASKPNNRCEVPGTGYFLKAMALFQDLHEEPTISYIKTLLVIAFYSTALNRRNSAYTYSGLALRLSLTLGLHRKPPDKLTAREREHRIRVWWTVYNLDRVCSSKVGLPVMLRDEDIDVPLPSMDNLTDDEKKDFHDPSYIIAQYKLAKITGEILNNIYRIPQPGQAKNFVHSVHTILKSLWSWHDTLPPILEFNQDSVPMYSSRSVASLHLNYGQCVILTTRPIFFHRLRAYHKASKDGNSGGPPPLPPITDDLAEACVHAARISSNIISQLRINSDLATFGFFDALSIFSSTLILMMSSAMQYKAHEGDRDVVESSLNLLKAMRDDGNMPALDYYKQLIQLKRDLDCAAQQLSGNPTATNVDGDRAGILQSSLEAGGDSVDLRSEARCPAAALLGEGLNFEAFQDLDMGAVLDVPSIQDFFAQKQPDAAWAVDESSSFDPGDFHGHEDFNLWDASLFGTF